MIGKRKFHVIALKERQGVHLPGLSALHRIIHYRFTGLRKACPVLLPAGLSALLVLLWQDIPDVIVIEIPENEG